MNSEVNGGTAGSAGMDTVFRKKVSGPELARFLHTIKRQVLDSKDLMFLCIGTDRSTGDSLGPLVGTMLEEAGYPHVIGTLQYPLDFPAGEQL
jgi:hypothetical protein